MADDGKVEVSGSAGQATWKIKIEIESSRPSDAVAEANASVKALEALKGLLDGMKDAIVASRGIMGLPGPALRPPPGMPVIPAPKWLNQVLKERIRREVDSAARNKLVAQAFVERFGLEDAAFTTDDIFEFGMVYEISPLHGTEELDAFSIILIEAGVSRASVDRFRAVLTAVVPPPPRPAR
jgi:hypothetical protein